MKFIALLFLTGVNAYATPATLNSLVCRSYDYYQLGGDRKVVELDIVKTADGVYEATLSHSYEVLVAQATFHVRDHTVDADYAGMTCLKAGPSDDERNVTCATPGVAEYVNLARLDRTTIMSAFSSRPGQVIKTATFEALAMTKNGTISPTFQDRDCVITP